MKQSVKDAARNAIGPLADALAGFGVTPNHLTLAGLTISTLAGITVARGAFTAAGILLLLGSLCDMLDGAVARRTQRSGPMGAFLDSTLDRLSEIVFFGGVMIYFADWENSIFFAGLAFFAAAGSLMVSYTRARAEGLGIECNVGWMERPERLVLLILACFFGATGLRWALILLTPLVFWTTWQRIDHVVRETRQP